MPFILPNLVPFVTNICVGKIYNVMDDLVFVLFEQMGIVLVKKGLEFAHVSASCFYKDKVIDNIIKYRKAITEHVEFIVECEGIHNLHF
jgi:hypothetical protein